VIEGSLLALCPWPGRSEQPDHQLSCRGAARLDRCQFCWAAAQSAAKFPRL